MIDRVLRVEALLALDADGDLADLHRRDRAIGALLPASPGGPAARVLGWAADREETVGVQVTGVDGAEHAARAALVLAGVLLGCLAASGVLYYDGAGRVNVLAALALLVGLQGVTLVLTVVLMLPPGARGALPGLGALQSALAAFSPGRAQRLIARFAPAPVRDDVARLVARGRADQRVYGRLRRWLALGGAQLFAVAFNAGLLAAYLAAVVFTDLAFGWSTTLEVQPQSVHRLTAVLSAPWAGWLPDAVPSAELVGASRYFRAGPRAVADASLLGQWWAFIAMCVLVYAAIPRAVLLALAVARTRAALEWTLVHLPGAQELLYRLDTEPVDTRADTPEQAAPTGEDGSEQAAGTGVHGPSSVIVWGDLELDEEAAASALGRAAGFTAARTLRAGAGTLEADDDAVREAAAAPEPVALLVKSWEPPLGEFVDFVQALRATAGETRPIGVVPLAPDPRGAPTAADLETWRGRLARMGDPWLTVHEVRR